ncbi:MAG: roadblock/LC7 domain-containing protein [Candidatus Thermoplasmatota archaeon]|nr:roadblock/LC7 domain-containing protein [Euryarchaeota archaeon]MBU4143562.1 roadblock/LC7 domain-containing protein [Candidatus Thermoplasmatota archaeon]MBU4591331.1 roadblock/LC7 domain-containing protein [Candidatus Thermoplasmatota archaeon]
MNEIITLLDQLMNVDGVLGCGVVTRDGRPVEMRLPDRMNQETVAIMCATVFGGSTTLHTEAGKSTPTSIKTKTDGYRTEIYQCGRRSLAIIMQEEKSDRDEVKKIVQMLGSEFGSI